MNIILSKPSKTILDIRNELGIPVYIKRRLPTYADTVIRWGSLREFHNAGKVYNMIQNIKLTSNKPKCRRFLAENGIPVPEMGSDKFPCVGRVQHHTGGKGFWFCQTPYDVERAKREGAYYFSHYYPKQKEYRVHIGKIDGEYKVILYSEKIGDKYGGVIWNHDIGNFKYEHLGRGERRRSIIQLAKDAIEVVGLDFGAVDIGANPLYSQFPKSVIFEINTAPALSPLGIKKYCEYFRKILDN